MKFIKRNLVKSRMNAFTLAEVLITLGIIGVVAAMTIPVLMNSIQENNYKVAYKKAFSVASQAWQSTYSDNLLEPSTGWVSQASSYNNFNQFMNKFDIVKTCTGSISECWAANEISNVWGGTTTDNISEVCFIDKSGMSWCNGRTYAYIFVDTNGLRNPNIFGKDRFPLFPCVGSGTAIDAPHAINTTGIPNVIKPWEDEGYSLNYCPEGKTHVCKYTSWLYN